MDDHIDREKLEDEIDLLAWYEAKAEFEADPVTISSEEIAEEFLGTESRVDN